MGSASDSSPNSPVDAVDIAIIGAGPTGLYAAFYAGLRHMSVKLIDSLEVLGGQLVTIYPEKLIFDVPGFPQILAKDLAANLIEQGMQYGATACLGEQVQALDFVEAEQLFHVRTARTVHLAKSVLIAAGVGSFVAKKLPLPGVERFEDHGLNYFVKTLGYFRGRRVLIVGGGDSAVDWANMIAPIAQELTLIHRRSQFRAHEDSVAKMHQGPTHILTPFELRRIEGENFVERAVIFDNSTPDKLDKVIDIDEILVNVGFDSSLGPIKEFGLEMEGGHIVVDSMMRTSRPGIFAAGDIATFAGKLKLIATGFGEACIAVNYAKQFLDPSASAFPGHSSSMKIDPAVKAPRAG